MRWHVRRREAGGGEVYDLDLWLVVVRCVLVYSLYMDTAYRTRLISRLNSQAVALQNLGRWDEADTLLILALRWEALWERAL